MLDAFFAATWPWWLTPLALFFAAPALLGPLMVKATLKPLVDAEIEPDQAEPSAELHAYFEGVTRAFGQAGFTPVGRYCARTERGGPQARMLLFRGANGASLGYAAELARQGAPLRYCEIGTFFEDGSSVTVGNSPMLGPFKARPETVGMHVPEIGDAQVLWQLHRLVVGARKVGLRAKRVREGEEVAAFVQGVARAVAYQQDCGFVAPADGGRHYVLTWWGAFRFTWLSMPPLGPLRRRRIRRRDAALLAEIGWPPGATGRAK